jgi:hypothetical protein
MEKVYQITKCIYEEYEVNENKTIGIFTDKEHAESILSKLISDNENELNDLYVKQDEFDNNEDKKFKDKTAFYSPYTDEYLEIDYKIRELQTTSYFMQEIIINQLYN